MGAGQGRPRGLGIPRWDRAAASSPCARPPRGRPPPARHLRRRAARPGGRATPPTPPASSARAGGPLPPPSPRTASTAAARRRSPRHRWGARCSRFARRCAWLPAPRSRLRYAYGAAQPRAIRGIVDALAGGAPAARAQPAPLGCAGCPQGSFGAGRRWLARELLGRVHRSLGRHLRGVRRHSHVISQGGYYQYGGFGVTDRVPRPAPAHAPDALRRARACARRARSTRRGSSRAAAARSPTAPSRSAGPPSCRPSNDMDLWLLWSAAEYGLATRDLALFDRPVPFRGGGTASLWRPPEAGVRPPGVAARAARRVSHARPPATGPTSPAPSSG